MTDVDVVVVGAGPAGTAMAVFLHHRGHRVRLLDEARFPRDKVCGEGVSPEAWRLLDAMGATPRVEALQPFALHGMALTAPDGTRFCGDYVGCARPGFALQRRALDLALLESARAAGIDVSEGIHVADLLREADAVTGVTTADGESIRARVVVGADGRRSVVARRLDLRRPHRLLDRFAVRGYWDDVAGLQARGEMHVGGGGYCGIAPLSPTRANITFVLGRREIAAAAGDLAGFYHTTLGRWPSVAERLAAARLQEPPRAIGPLAYTARRVAVPGALLVGDAAGFYDPFTGEGITLALRGAELAAGVISTALARPGVPDLQEYARLRRAATRDKFRLNHLLQLVVAWPALANHVAQRLSRRPDLANRLVSIAGDFRPARDALRLRFAWQLLFG